MIMDLDEFRPIHNLWGAIRFVEIIEIMIEQNPSNQGSRAYVQNVRCIQGTESQNHAVQNSTVS